MANSKQGLKTALCVALWLAASGWIGATDTASHGPAAVAVVCLVEGQVTASGANDQHERALAVLDRVEPGETLTTGSSSRLVMTFFDGQRFELSGTASARVRTNGLEPLHGDLRRLSPVATTPDLSPIARSEAPGRATAAARLRSDPENVAESRLEPFQNDVVLADDCELRFTPRPGIQRYGVTVEDESFVKILQVSTRSGTVPLPSDLLKPGAEYFWAVCPLNHQSASDCPGAVFTTLPEDLVARRGQLEARLAGRQDPDVLVLLAELDRCLGLHRQACDRLHAGVELGADGDSIARAFELVGCRAPGSRTSIANPR